MKDKKQISKKLNIIIYIILIGIIISLLVDKNIIIGKEKQIIKEMTQSENEANLQNQIDELNAVQEEYATNVQAYKKQIAEAITSQGVTTSENDEGSVIAENILKILQAKTSDATASAGDILSGKTAYVNGELITGTAAAVNKRCLYIGACQTGSTSSSNIGASFIDGSLLADNNGTYTVKKDVTVRICSYTDKETTGGTFYGYKNGSQIYSLEGYWAIGWANIVELKAGDTLRFTAASGKANEVMLNCVFIYEV